LQPVRPRATTSTATGSSSSRTATRCPAQDSVTVPTFRASSRILPAPATLTRGLRFA